MNDLKSMKDLLIKAPSTTYPSLIMCNDTLPEDPCPVLTILLKIGSQGFMVAVPGEEEVMEAVDAHLQIIRSDPDTLLTEFRGDLPAVAGRTNAGVTSVILLDVPESMVGCFKRTPTRLTNWPNNLYRFGHGNMALESRGCAPNPAFSSPQGGPYTYRWIAHIFVQRSSLPPP